MVDAPDPLAALTGEQLLTVEQLAGLCLRKGATLGDVRGYADDELEAVYHLAYNAYRQRKYEDAQKLFFFLAENNHLESRFWMGLAASHQMTGGYDSAVAAYGAAALLDATNPEPPLCAGECFLAMGNLQAARQALDAVRILCAAGEEEYGEVLRRLGLLSSAIEQAEGARSA